MIKTCLNLDQTILVFKTYITKVPLEIPPHLTFQKRCQKKSLWGCIQMMHDLVMIKSCGSWSCKVSGQLLTKIPRYLHQQTTLLDQTLFFKVLQSEALCHEMSHNRGLLIDRWRCHPVDHRHLELEALSKDLVALHLNSPEVMQVHHLLKGRQICRDHPMFICLEVRHLKDMLKDYRPYLDGYLLINHHMVILLEDHQICQNKDPCKDYHMAILLEVRHLIDHLI